MSKGFFCIIKQQQPLLCFGKQENLVHLEDHFRAFKAHVANSSASQTGVKLHDGSIQQGSDVCGKVSSTFVSRFRQMIQCGGGLATIFPNTSTVESDFSVLQ